MSIKSSARAHANLALVKYWGKRDESLVLPHQSSLSATLAPLAVEATVEVNAVAAETQVNGQPAQEADARRIAAVLQAVSRERGQSLGSVRVATRGNFPPAAGLASSAAAYAAVAVAARAAAGLSRDVAAASRAARVGSGSACRSVQGGFCVWRRGTRDDGEDSYAHQVFTSDHWPQLGFWVALVDRGEKEVGSRDGMRHTVETSPYYAAWIESAEAEVPLAHRCLERRDLEGLGRIAERNAWRMHATAFAADPPLCYFQPATLALIGAVARARKRGLPVWFSLDAGPNPVLIADRADGEEVVALAVASGAREVIACTLGPDAELSQNHLF